ncbi:MAG: HAD-IIB family hydrolase [Planctomycetes bacterium]|nr:HAD-IIB family hydrolase [Planctomycetota bacterium]
MARDLLISTDLDRTLLPNGDAEESPRARPLFRRLAQRPEVAIAYVSGRRRALIEEAIAQYELPEPAFAVGDVGTSIYEVGAGGWNLVDAWSREIAADWAGLDRDRIAALLEGVADLRAQPAEAQGRFKLSFFVSLDADAFAILETLRSRLRGAGVRASLIWSIDDAEGVGLLDVLPERATKLHAVRFLMERYGFAEPRTVYAGDSGNDLAPLTSGLQAVLVGNARDDVRAEALARVEKANRSDRLYCPRGGFLGMNGNYAAGILEGLVHFIPEVRAWLAD